MGARGFSGGRSPALGFQLAISRAEADDGDEPAAGGAYGGGAYGGGACGGGSRSGAPSGGAYDGHPGGDSERWRGEATEQETILAEALREDGGGEDYEGGYGAHSEGGYEVYAAMEEEDRAFEERRQLAYEVRMPSG